jgi:hypothetical protein
MGGQNGDAAMSDPVRKADGNRMPRIDSVWAFLSIDKDGDEATVRVFRNIGFTSSVCAELSVQAADVEREVSEILGSEWVAIDLARVREGPPTPNPCHHPPSAASHQHWFLMTREAARKFGFIAEAPQ